MSQIHEAAAPAFISAIHGPILRRITDLEFSVRKCNASVVAHTNGLTTSLTAIRQSVDHLATSVRTPYVPPTDKKPGKGSLNGRIPTLRFVHLNSGDVEMLENSENMIARFHRAGGPLKHIQGYNIHEQKQFANRPARQTLNLYLRDWGALDQLREQEMAITIINMLGLSPQVCLEREICWVQVFHLLNLKVDKPDKLKDRKASWARQSKLKIQRVDFKCGRLLMAFHDATEAEKACRNIFWMDNLPFMAV